MDIASIFLWIFLGLAGIGTLVFLYTVIFKIEFYRKLLASFNNKEELKK